MAAFFLSWHDRGTCLTAAMSTPTPYDQTFKSLTEHDPKTFLRCMRAIGAEEPVTVLTLPRELRTPVRIPDLLYEVRSGKDRRLVHVEAQARYHSSLPERVLEYAALAWLQHRMPVVSYVLLLTARDCPVSLEGEGETQAGGLRMRYERIKLWEVAADEALALDQPSLLPFVPLMRGDESALRRVVRRLGLIADDALRRDLTFHFVLLGCLRYDRQALLQLLRGHIMTDGICAESSFYQYILNEGIEKGIEKGIEQGRTEGVTEGESRMLRRLLERRFGPLPTWATEKIGGASLEILEGWGVRAFECPESGLEELLA